MLPLLTLAASLAGQAGPPPAPPPPCPGSAIFIAEICRGMNHGRYHDSAVRELRRRDLDGNGLDPGDIEMLRLRRQARERAESLRNILVYDLDGDFSIDRAEMERAVPTDFFANDGTPSSNADERRRQLFFTYDADRDDRIERDEILSAPLPQDNLGLLEGLRATLALDPNGDARLEEAELLQLTQRAFAEIDADRDGVVSDIEFQLVYEQWVARLREGPRDGYSTPLCAMPAVPPDAALILYTSHHGLLELPEGPAGGPSSATDVLIETGTQPLYLILTSFQPIVWRFSGDVDRIVRVVLSSETREAHGSIGSEATGVPADRVTAFREDCLEWATRIDRFHSGLPNLVWRSAGRRPDVAVGTPSAASVSLPSGRAWAGPPAR